MAATGTLTASCVVTGLTTGSKTIAPPSVSLLAVIGTITEVSLTAVTNITITVPSGSTYCVVGFPVTAATVLLKGVAGDAGVTILTNPSFASFVVLPVQGAASFVMNASVTTAIEVNFL